MPDTRHGTQQAAPIDDVGYQMPDIRGGMQQAAQSGAQAVHTDRGEGIKRSERKGSVLNGFDDTEVEA